jgi:hypothetical protein
MTKEQELYNELYKLDPKLAVWANRRFTQYGDTAQDVKNILRQLAEHAEEYGEGGGMK